LGHFALFSNFELLFFSAERLNLYIDRHEGLEQTEDEVPGVTFRDEPKTPREKLKQVNSSYLYVLKQIF
jgi:hypothetical protein